LKALPPVHAAVEIGDVVLLKWLLEVTRGNATRHTDRKGTSPTEQHEQI